MLDLHNLLRTRIAKQLGMGEKQTTNFTLMDGLKQAIWIYGDFGLTARIGSSLRSPQKRLKKENRVKLPLGRAYRIFNCHIAAKIYSGFQTPIQDQELLNHIPPDGIDRQSLAQKLDMTIRDLNYRIRKEQNNWQVVKHDDTIYIAKDFFSRYSQPADTRERILDILEHYPYCSVDQIELFTNLSREQLAGPIAQLAMDDLIIRGLTREEAPDEIFCLPDEILLSNSKELPTIVLEKRDALVEMIKLERYFTHEDGDYWIFIDGLPQAEFDLDKQKGKNTYSVKNLKRFITTSYDLGDILYEIARWGKDQYLQIRIDHVSDPITTTFQVLTQQFIERGYQLKNDSLLLDRSKHHRSQTTVTEKVEGNREPDILDWQILGPWCRNRQFMQFDGTTSELLYHLGPIDDINSIAYRLQTNPERLDFEDVAYIPGINLRMGFVHKSHVEDIIRGWPKRTKFNFLDKKILAQLQEPKTTMEIIEAIDESAISVRQRLRYLEQTRSIRKVLPGSLHMEKCLWTPFDEGLHDYNKPVGGKRAMASVGTFLKLAIENNPPLTKLQLSKYLGLTVKELEPLIRQYLRTNKIIEGYFVTNISDIQYTLPEVIDTITVRENEEEDFAAVNRVDILPLSDPFALFHLPVLVMDDPSIQPTQRLDEYAEQWMVMWDGIPVGYIIKQPTTQQLLDYKLDLKITKDMITTPIIAGTLQKIVSLFRTWYGDEGKISTINDIEASNSKWKDIHFLIESIGIKMD